MNYTLNNSKNASDDLSFSQVLTKMWVLMRDEKRSFIFAMIANIINSGLTLAGPFLVGHVINTYIVTKNYKGVLMYSGMLVIMYVTALIANYYQVKTMGGVGQRVLFQLRTNVFKKLQELPVAFFNQNKAGDLISRINNDTDKLNQFFSQGLMQFIGNILMVIGAGIFLLVINLKLGVVVLIPALGLLILTRVVSNWIKQRNLKDLQSTGAMSAEIQESLNNFKVVIAFDRRDYFREKFNTTNEENYRIAVNAGISNTFLVPVFDFASNVAQIGFMVYGIYLITTGNLSVGFFISFLAYINRFYDPLRQMASIWSTFQTALAGWDRISEMLALESNLPIINESAAKKNPALLEFSHVSFNYGSEKVILDEVNFALEAGKIYALVGPTGGGKTTTASLMARLYDPSSGHIMLHGKDIRSYSEEVRTQKIGFILQEPFLFTGTVKENILYGNDAYQHFSDEALTQELQEQNLTVLLERFPQGLASLVSTTGDSISLGQRQLIAFIRILLRKPELLILDEATANIDTVTEQLLEDILSKLPKTTTQVIIAHRLNTIANADEIFFVNGGHITPAGSLEHAVEMLMHGKRKS